MEKKPPRPANKPSLLKRKSKPASAPASEVTAAAAAAASAVTSGNKTIATTFAEAKPKVPAKKIGLMRGLWLRLMYDDAVTREPVIDERQALAQRRHIMRIIHIQNMVIAGLIATLLLGVPFFQPFYDYYRLSPSKEVGPLIKLDAPNLTNEAVLSWATTAITEVMTLGFGDFDRQIAAQRKRFTYDGWKSFADALTRDKLRETFQGRQLVLTSVPSDTPVIVEQGPTEEDAYSWKVELPIIMTYTTNNNVTRRERGIVTLLLVRVPSSENISGIAIKNWKMGRSQ